jgi:hypothetical protein
MEEKTLTTDPEEVKKLYLSLVSQLEQVRHQHEMGMFEFLIFLCKHIAGTCEAVKLTNEEFKKISEEMYQQFVLFKMARQKLDGANKKD